MSTEPTSTPDFTPASTPDFTPASTIIGIYVEVET